MKKVLAPFRSYKFNYCYYGALFGLTFPLIATFLKSLECNCNFISAQTTNGDPLIWIIDTAPLFLGWFASFAGQKQERIENELHLEKQKVQQTAKLAALGEMSSGISHELSNPLGVIAGYAEINNLLLGKDEIDAKAVVRNNEKIYDAIFRMKKIIKGLQGFARVEADEDFKNESATNIIDQTLELAKAKLKEHNVEVLVNINEEVKINCNHIQISQVLLNLIINSIDAIKNEKEKWVKVEVFSKDNHVILKISDSGRGISPEVVENLFQPFFTTKDVGEGTGLGMSISKQIIEAHSGSIKYQEVDGNTGFEIKLPLSPILS